MTAFVIFDVKMTKTHRLA